MCFRYVNLEGAPVKAPGRGEAPGRTRGAHTTIR